MREIEKLNMRVKRAEGGGIFHDSREDVRRLGEAINYVIDKQNEIISAVNYLIRKQDQ